LDGHGWAEEGTIAATFNLRKTRPDFVAALRSLSDEGAIVPCSLGDGDSRRAGWIRPRDLAAADALRRARPRGDARLPAEHESVPAFHALANAFVPSDVVPGFVQ
jgi:hypothetical protein